MLRAKLLLLLLVRLADADGIGVADLLSAVVGVEGALGDAGVLLTLL